MYDNIVLLSKVSTVTTAARKPGVHSRDFPFHSYMYSSTMLSNMKGLGRHPLDQNSSIPSFRFGLQAIHAYHKILALSVTIEPGRFTAPVWVNSSPVPPQLLSSALRTQRLAVLFVC